MTWLSYVMLGTILFGAHKYERLQQEPRLSEYQTASSAYVLLVNQTDDTLPIAVMARKVDHAVRFLGWVTARDSVMIRLPYADTKVTLLVAGQWFEFDVKGPSVTRIAYRLPGSQP